MKFLRIIAFIVCISLLCGCSPRTSNDAPKFYYLRSDIQYNSTSGVIASETPDDISTSDDLFQIIELYLTGPQSGSLRTPFPDDVQIMKVEQLGDSIILEFNDRLGVLTGMDLTLACACVSKTCLGLTDAVAVSIRAQNTTLDGAEQITMDADALVLLDNS